MNILIRKTIEKDPYLREWRQKTAILLMNVGMSDRNIANAISGGIRNHRECRNVCDADNISYKEVRKILGLW